jgi:hypothetical protein
MKYQHVIAAVMTILFFAEWARADVALESRPLGEIALECQQLGIECAPTRPAISPYYDRLGYPTDYSSGLERGQIRESQKTFQRSMRNINESVRRMRTNIERVKPYGRGLRY